ncbi:MAG: sugar transferase [Chloroflexales bacterium]
MTNANIPQRDAALTRIIDVTAAAAGLLILSPLLIVVALVIKRTDGGPVFYRARRVGLHGHLFQLYKFRTMRVGADRQGPGITTSGDQRVTSVGRWLRRMKLDELPQLLNVLKGDMSLVGPRPEDPRYVALYTPEQRKILSVRPGITSAASLTYRHEEQILSGPDWEAIYRNEVMPAKLKIDLAYLAQRTLWSDIGLVLRTILAILR